MLSLTQQFFLGRVDTHNSRTDDPAAIAGYDAVVHTNAAQLEPEILTVVPHPILIEWELDPVSSASFLARIEAAVRLRLSVRLSGDVVSRPRRD